VLLEQGGTLKELLKVAYPDANAILAAIRSIEFSMQDQPEDLSDKWVTARVNTDEGTKFIIISHHHSVGALQSRGFCQQGAWAAIGVYGAEEIRVGSSGVF